jgi:hypothetical protein
MDNYYDPATREWVTGATRYDAVLAESRFAPIREYDTLSWHPDRAWTLLLELLAAVPSDTVALVGAGPLDNFMHQHGATFIEPIVDELAHNGRLRTAIVNVNLERGTLPDAVEANCKRQRGRNSSSSTRLRLTNAEAVKGAIDDARFASILISSFGA